MDTFNFLLNPLFSFFFSLCQFPTNEILNFPASLIGCCGFSKPHPIGWVTYTFIDTRLLLKLTKREDQALISISTIPKFSGLVYRCLMLTYLYLCFHKKNSALWRSFLTEIWTFRPVCPVRYLTVHRAYNLINQLSNNQSINQSNS